MLYNDSDKKIQGLVNNELESVDHFLPEWCPNSEIGTISTESTVKSVRSNKMLREEIRARHYNKNKVRDSWLESHIMPEKFEPKSSLGSVPRVETVEINGEPPPSEGVVTPPPSELPAFQAVLWEAGAQGVDMRPHIYDKFSGQYMLLDSGAQISACPPDPGDVEDPSMT